MSVISVAQSLNCFFRVTPWSNKQTSTIMIYKAIYSQVGIEFCRQVQFNTNGTWWCMLIYGRIGEFRFIPTKCVYNYNYLKHLYWVQYELSTCILGTEIKVLRCFSYIWQLLFPYLNNTNANDMEPFLLNPSHRWLITLDNWVTSSFIPRLRLYVWLTSG